MKSLDVSRSVQRLSTFRKGVRDMRFPNPARLLLPNPVVRWEKAAQDEDTIQ
jgi:hypothetical protein